MGWSRWKRVERRPLLEPWSREGPGTGGGGRGCRVSLAVLVVGCGSGVVPGEPPRCPPGVGIASALGDAKGGGGRDGGGGRGGDREEEAEAEAEKGEGGTGAPRKGAMEWELRYLGRGRGKSHSLLITLKRFGVLLIKRSKGRHERGRERATDIRRIRCL